MQYRSNCCCSSNNWFFWIFKNCVEAQFSFSQSSWFMSNLLNSSRRLWRLVSFSMMLPTVIFIVVSISSNMFSVFALLGEAEFARARIKDATRWWGSELQGKIDSFTRFEEMDKDIGTCFLIQVVLFVFKVLLLETNRFKVDYCWSLKGFCSLVYLIPKRPDCQRVYRIWYMFLGDIFQSFSACS